MAKVGSVCCGVTERKFWILKVVQINISNAGMLVFMLMALVVGNMNSESFW